MIYLLLLGLCLLGSIPSLVLSVVRAIKTKNLMAGMIMLLSIIVVTTIVSAMYHAGNIYELVRNVGGIEGVSKDLIILLVRGGIVGTFVIADIILFLLVKFCNEKNLWIWVISFLAFFVGCCLMVGVVGSVLTGYSLDYCFFGACCAFMGTWGVAWGLSYKEICVIGNIYIEAAICLLSTLLVTWNCIKCFLNHKALVRALLMLLGVGYGLFGLIVFACICYHYAMPLEEAFDLCYRELIWMAKTYHTTYNIVNYVIFIFLFLVITIGNVLVAKLIKVIGK